MQLTDTFGTHLVEGRQDYKEPIMIGNIKMFQNVILLLCIIIIYITLI